MNFLKPEHCTLNRDRTPWNPHRPTNRAKGERYQVQCFACKRWCYVADRCNLFVACEPRKRRSESEPAETTLPRTEVCPRCHGSGGGVTRDGIELDCSKCKGTGGVAVSERPGFTKLTDAVIVEMRWTCAHGNMYERWIATAACGCDRPSQSEGEQR